jgi:small acid-soluble spore protein F (minor alpha/beta-type SASP)
MGRRKRGVMSDKLKEEVAKELGVNEQVQRDNGWDNVSSKDCGSMVTKAIEIANDNVENNNQDQNTNNNENN